MASTNKTTNYELSQYIGTDKPTYLVDYNSDMSKIDVAIKNAYDRGSLGVTNAATAQSAAETADGKATNAATAAASAQSTAESAATAASTADGKAVNAQTTANSALAGTVENAAKINNFNLTVYKDLTVSSTTNCTVNTNSMKMARNADGSLAKIYGYLKITVTSNANTKIVLNAQDGTGLAPAEDISINFCAIQQGSSSGFGYKGFTIKPNGDIEINFYGRNSDVMELIFVPCLYYVKDFGDNPNA